MKSRYVVRQLLHALSTHMRVDYHELYRIAKGPDGQSLKERERLYLLRTLQDYDEVCERLSRFGQHLQKGL